MAHMTGYHFCDGCVDVYVSDGRTLRIYFNKFSGKVYWRPKVGHPWIKHTGVYLGEDIHGTQYMVHNHLHVGKAHITTLEDFAQRRQLNLYHEYCTNPWNIVVEKALLLVLNGTHYLPFSSNCQTLVNDACHNVRRSEDGARVAKNIAGFAGLFLLIGLISKL